MADIRGKAIVEQNQGELIDKIKGLKEKGVTPTLAIVRVGERPDDMAYERGATNRFKKLELNVHKESLDQDIDQESFNEVIEKLNRDDNIHGILVLNPLPEQLSIDKVIEILNPKKDIDGLTTENMAKVYQGDETGFAPCTAQGVIDILETVVGDLTGKKITIIGTGLVIGKPVSLMAMNKRATITACNSRTPDTKKECREADIIISAVGRAKMVNEEYVSEGQTIIDVGINEDEEGNMCGDVDYDAVKDIVANITPVPGGVGSVTTFVLAKQVVKAAENSL
ncbi:MAG: bifunctional 5,10-methylenetetrahydrofolate dehydrogenase/5,10-methenyltetrahydrofolate cyclohydrolase [Tissierellia bacterium]|nr:bifunctional 5,10-methylenetetrahydrofolate dehydrogenase/5,10-methenyltetrahydrofolate cyclohydrolase [Tissierellia bacterium]